MSLLLFSLLLIAYYALHSLLANHQIKEKLSSVIPNRWYRLFFNTVSIGLLVFLFSYFRQLPEAPFLLNQTTLTTWVGKILLGLGGVLLLLALGNYHFGEFSGFYQLNHKGDEPKTTLNRKGLNRFVRHPLYTATFCLLWGYFLYFPALKTVCLAAVSSLYLIIGTMLEEQKLIGIFGEDYIRYKKEVGRFLPKIVR